MAFQSLDDVHADYELLDADDRYRLLIDLGRTLEPMPDALKTDATLVRGCSAAVWVYPVPREDGRLHFLADSNAAITKGIVALILLAVQDRRPEQILALDIESELARFDLKNQLSSNRTQGIPNMIALIRETAERLGVPARIAHVEGDDLLARAATVTTMPFRTSSREAVKPLPVCAIEPLPGFAAAPPGAAPRRG